MATVSGGYKINAQVSGGAATGFGVSTVIYTAPANCFAIVQISMAVTVTFGSSDYNVIMTGSSGTSYITSTTTVAAGNTGRIMMYGVYVGPGQSVSISSSGGFGSLLGTISGVEFKNI